MVDYIAVATPIESGRKLDTEQKSSKSYREFVGCILYAMFGARPDLSFSIIFLRRYQYIPCEDLWIALKRGFRSIKGN